MSEIEKLEDVDLRVAEAQQYKSYWPSMDGVTLTSINKIC
jgi:hypothetical protein